MRPHQRDAFYWQFPAGVQLDYRDGRRELRPFASRLEAEAWLALMPMLMALGHEEAAGVTAAVLVTMLGQGLGRGRIGGDRIIRP